MKSNKKVNFIKHLINVNELFFADKKITPHHISLYYSLFMSWNNFNFCSPLSISRSEQMNQSKIGSVNTYLKCLKELENWGYLKYNPSHNPQKGSLVYLFTFDTTASTTDDTSTDTTDEQLMRPLIKNNKLNKTVETKQTHKTYEKKAIKKKTKDEILFSEESKDETLFVQAESKVDSRINQHSFPSSLQEVQVYFSEKEFTPTEAEKFYNYFESNGWLVGGRSKMKNWKAAANNWMLNFKKFNPMQNANHYYTNEDKDYSIPL